MDNFLQAFFDLDVMAQSLPLLLRGALVTLLKSPNFEKAKSIIVYAFYRMDVDELSRYCTPANIYLIQKPSIPPCFWVQV